MPSIVSSSARRAWPPAWLVCVLSGLLLWSGAVGLANAVEPQRWLINDCATSRMTWDMPTTYLDGSPIEPGQLKWYFVSVSRQSGGYEGATLLKQFKADVPPVSCASFKQLLGEDFAYNTDYYLVVQAETRVSETAPLTRSGYSQEIVMSVAAPVVPDKTPQAPTHLRCEGACVVIVGNNNTITINQQ